MKLKRPRTPTGRRGFNDLEPMKEDESPTDLPIEEPMHQPLVLLDSDDNLPAVSNPALHRYLQEISQYELLSREETEELAIRFKETGDPNAAYRLVSSNLRLVVKVAMDFQKYWMQNLSTKIGRASCRERV